MSRRRFFVLASLGAILLIAVLLGIIYATTRGPYDLARARWSQKGSGSYSLVISQVDVPWCLCGLVGEFRITVRAGRVTDYEMLKTVDGSDVSEVTAHYNPASFDQFTVAKMLTRADANMRNAWIAPWMLIQYSAAYDPTYGYITRYVADSNGTIARWTGRADNNSGYIYTARDLVLAP